MLRPAFAYGKLPARDIERARQFYADGHLYHDVGGCRFMVFTSAGTAPGTHDQLGFVTADLAGHSPRCEAGRGAHR